MPMLDADRNDSGRLFNIACRSGNKEDAFAKFSKTCQMKNVKLQLIFLAMLQQNLQ
jgi:hypothetical protein